MTMSFASKMIDLTCLPQGSRSHCEQILHERHWTTVAYNSSKEATTALEQKTLLTCSICSSPDRRAHMITSFGSAPILIRGSLNIQIEQYPLTIALEKRLIPHIVLVVLSPDVHGSA